MAEIGVCSDKDGTITLESLDYLGSTWDRWTADPEYIDQHKVRARVLREAGIDVFLTNDMTSYARFGDPFDPAVQEKAIDFYAGEYGDLVSIHNPVNEPDGVQFESSTMPVAMVNHILYYSRQKWPRSVPLAGVGGVTGMTDYYNDVEWQWLQYWDDHLYAKFAPVESPGPDFSLERAIDIRVNLARSIGLGFLMSEIGLNSWQVGEQRQAEFVRNTLSYVKARSDVHLALHFCAHPYEGWGLMGQDGNWKLAADEFRIVTGVAGNNDGNGNGNGEHMAMDRSKWQGKIGSGLLDMMDADGTQPAQRSSTWLPLGVSPSDIEEARGQNGTLYVWHLDGSGAFRFPPDR